MTDMQEFVVPKSIPITFAIKNLSSLVHSWNRLESFQQRECRKPFHGEKSQKPLIIKEKMKIEIGMGVFVCCAKSVVMAQ